MFMRGNTNSHIARERRCIGGEGGGGLVGNLAQKKR